MGRSHRAARAGQPRNRDLDAFRAEQFKGGYQFAKAIAERFEQGNRIFGGHG